MKEIEKLFNIKTQNIVIKLNGKVIKKNNIIIQNNSDI